MNTYYITGISGFLGRNIVRHLNSQKDVQIVGLVFPNEKGIDDLREQENITLIEGNILHQDEVEKFLSYPSKGNKIIIHAAGKISVYKKGDPMTTTINVEGTKVMVDTALKVGCDGFIYVSSVDSLDKRKGNDVIHEQDTYDIDKVDGVYSKSKVQANNYVLNAYRNKGLPVIIVLPSALIGPYDPFNSPINFAIKRFLLGKLPALVKGQYNVADIRDVAKGIVDASISGKTGESYILCGPSVITMLDLVNKAAEIEHKKPIKLLVPIWLVKLGSPFIELAAKIKKKSPLFTGFSMDCLQQNSNYSYEKAHNDFGYNPQDINTTMVDLINWMKESGYLEKK